MNTPAAPSPGFFRRHGVLLTLAGFLLGAAAGTFIYTVETPVYESTVQFRPLRPAHEVSDISRNEWFQNEMTALGSEQCLLRVVKNLNLENEFHMTAGEAVAEVKQQLSIRPLPGTTIIEVAVQGRKARECASLVNAVVAARAEMTALAIDGEHRRAQQMYEARVNTLTASVAAKHRALSAAPAGDTAAREALAAEKAQLAGMQSRLAEASLIPSIPPYAETLQEGKQPLLPVGPVWFPRTARWTVIGTVMGLTLSLCLAAFRRRMDRSPARPPVFPPRPVAAGEY